MPSWMVDIKEAVTLQSMKFSVRVKSRFERSEGQGMVEYALILAFIAILVIVALRFLQPAISTSLNKVATSL